MSSAWPTTFAGRSTSAAWRTASDRARWKALESSTSKPNAKKADFENLLVDSILQVLVKTVLISSSTDRCPFSPDTRSVSSPSGPPPRLYITVWLVQVLVKMSLIYILLINWLFGHREMWAVVVSTNIFHSETYTLLSYRRIQGGSLTSQIRTLYSLLTTLLHCQSSSQMPKTCHLSRLFSR